MENLLILSSSFIFAFLCFIAQSKAQTDSPLTYSPDGIVTNMIAKGDTLIVGGTFNHVGKYTGGGALFSSASAQPDLSFPKFNGSVYRSTSDGNGGFYVIGNFYKESENPGDGKGRLEHLLANNTFDPNFSLNVEYANLVSH